MNRCRYRMYIEQYIDCSLDGLEPCGECGACELEALDPDRPIPFTLTDKAKLYLETLA